MVKYWNKLTDNLQKLLISLVFEFLFAILYCWIVNVNYWTVMFFVTIIEISQFIIREIEDS